MKALKHYAGKYNNQISSIIAAIFAILFLLITVAACVVLGPIFIDNANLGDFFMISVSAIGVFIFPAVGIYYSTRYFLRRKIFWSNIPKGVPVLKKPKKIEYQIMHTHLH